MCLSDTTSVRNVCGVIGSRNLNSLIHILANAGYTLQAVYLANKLIHY